MQIRDVIQALEQVAPLSLQADFDNAGLQIGQTDIPLSAALLTLDVTEEVVEEALSLGCNLIISHHPLIFHPLKQVTSATYIERVIVKALRNDITIVSMHTNFDATLGGVNYKIGEKISLQDMTFFGETKEINGVLGGDGVVGTLPESLDPKDFISMLKERFSVACIQTNGLLNRSISKVAICGGAGAFMLNEAINNGADAFITGEMRYNEFFDHDNEIQITVIGHYQSEQFTPEIFHSILTKIGAICHISNVNTNPIQYF